MRTDEPHAQGDAAIGAEPAIWRLAGDLPTEQVAFASRSLFASITTACHHPANAMALAGNHETIDRGALLDQVRRVAAKLRRSVAPGQAVATLVPQTPRGVAALLGCAAAGRVCIALNSGDPAERIGLMLDDAAPAVVLFDDTASCRGALPAGAAAIALSDCLNAEPDNSAPAPHDPDAPCMVHYTSGSSGRPKGIVLSSYAVLTRAYTGITRQHLGARDRFLVPTTIADASSLSAILAALCSGGTKLVVSIADEGAHGLLRLAAREGVTVLSSTAALLRTLRPLAALPAAIARLRLLRVGGAGLPGDDLAAWRTLLPAGCAISHAYGSSEALVVSEWHVPLTLQGPVAQVGVGRLLDGVSYMLLDRGGRSLAHGEAGELVLRGRQIALGEWQAGRLVPGRMQPDPTRPGERIFRTGDLLRMGDDGVMHFEGRVDRQVKVNGVRVELAEIEAVLRGNPAVRDAAVLQDASGTLHAFVATAVAAGDSLTSRLRKRLRAALPPPMRPRRITLLPTLPLLPSGKHDTQALRRQFPGQESGDA